MSIFVMPERKTALGHISQHLGEGIGQGLQQKMQALQTQKRNTSSAEGLADQLGLKEDKKSNFVKTFSQFSPEEQPKAFEQLITSQVLANYLQQAQGQQGQSEQGEPLSEDIKDIASQSILNQKDIPAIGKLQGLATQQQENKKLAFKQREIDEKKVEKYLDKVKAEEEKLPERRISLNAARSSIQSGQMKPLGGDFWSDVLNIPALKSASGAQLSTAAKTNLMGSLGRISGARPNQFIEQQINNAFPRAGQTREANLAQLLILESLLDLDEKRVDIANQVKEQQEEKYGRALPSLESDVNKSMRPYFQNRMDELEYDLQKNIEDDMGTDKLQKIKPVVKGTPLTIEKAQILLQQVNGDEEKAMKLALGLGYKIPKEEIYNR